MISRDQRTPLGEWWWTVDRLLLAGLIALMLGGIILSLAASPPVAARIGLVRALVRRPLVLCLDNADASLDLEGLRRLGEVLNELKGRTTTFIASSAPALLQLADVRYRVDRRRTAS